MMKHLFRFLAPAVLLAVFGFSFSLATSPTPAPRSRPGPRATGFIGGALRFTTPFTVGSGDPAFNTDVGGAVSTDPQGFDLGDALLGSQTVRYITAAGGYMPYTFIAKPNFDFLPPGQTPPLPHLSRLGVFNELIGTYNPNAIVTPMPNLLGAYRFDATLDDVIGTGRAGMFRLNVFGAAGERFRFAHDKLPAAQLGNSYVAALGTLSGRSPVRYSINGSVTADTTYSTLEEIGLSLTPSGILYGRPLKMSGSGTISFSARATDVDGALARSRDNSVVDQQFTITVENNTSATTEVTAFDASLKVNQAAPDTDRFVYSGLIDLRGDTLPALAGAVFTLRLGNAEFSGTFDEAGRVRGLSSDGSILAVTLGSGGTVKIDLQNATLEDALGVSSLSGNVDNFLVVVGFEFRTFRTSDIVNMRGRERSDKLALTYSYRRDARPNSNTSGNGAPVGAFQIVSVAGIDGVFNAELNDQVPGDPGDTWLVRFIGIPRYAIDSGADGALPDRTSSSGSINAKIEVGSGFTQDVSAPKVGPRFRFKADKLHDAGVLDLAIDPVSYVHRLKTAVLPDFDTGIPQAIETKDPNVFTLRMSINGFIGETGRIIVPNRTRWDMR